MRTFNRTDAQVQWFLSSNVPAAFQALAALAVGWEEFNSAASASDNGRGAGGGAPVPIESWKYP